MGDIDLSGRDATGRDDTLVEVRDARTRLAWQVRHETEWRDPPRTEESADCRHERRRAARTAPIRFHRLKISPVVVVRARLVRHEKDRLGSRRTKHEVWIRHRQCRLTLE